MNRLPANFVVIDCETTGLDTERHGIVSIGAVKSDGTTFYRECCPGGVRKDVDPAAMAVNGFDTAEVFERPTTAGNAVLALCEWIRGSYPRIRWIHGGKNPQFDRGFLARELARWRVANDPVTKEMAACQKWAEEWLPVSRRVVDVHAWAYLWAMRGGRDMTGLTFTVGQIYDELDLHAEANPHNALAGARCAMEAFRKLMDEFSPPKPDEKLPQT